MVCAVLAASASALSDDHTKLPEALLCSVDLMKPPEVLLCSVGFTYGHRLRPRFQRAQRVYRTLQGAAFVGGMVAGAAFCCCCCHHFRSSVFTSFSCLSSLSFLLQGAHLSSSTVGLLQRGAASPGQRIRGCAAASGFMVRKI